MCTIFSQDRDTVAVPVQEVSVWGWVLDLVQAGVDCPGWDSGSDVVAQLVAVSAGRYHRFCLVKPVLVEQASAPALAPGYPDAALVVDQGQVENPDLVLVQVGDRGRGADPVPVAHPVPEEEEHQASQAQEYQAPASELLPDLSCTSQDTLIQRQVLLRPVRKRRKICR